VAILAAPAPREEGAMLADVPQHWVLSGMLPKHPSEECANRRRRQRWDDLEDDLDVQML
jgi:hypothetical protein